MSDLVRKLLELGFELKENYVEGNAYVFKTSTSNEDRFVYDFAYYPDENKFYINAYKSSFRTISENELLRNCNELCTSAKNEWLKIKDELKEFDFSICDF